MYNEINKSMISDSLNKPVVLDIEKITLCNTNYRTTISTLKNVQVTVMDIKENEDIGLEVHNTVDQILFIVSGCGYTEIKRDNEYLKLPVYPGSMVVVPMGYYHNIVNTSNNDLKLFTVYAKPNHKENTVHRTKEEAAKEEY